MCRYANAMVAYANVGYINSDVALELEVFCIQRLPFLDELNNGEAMLRRGGQMKPVLPLIPLQDFKKQSVSVFRGSKSSWNPLSKFFKIIKYLSVSGCPIF